MPEVYARSIRFEPPTRGATADIFLESLREWLGPKWPADQQWLDLDTPRSFRDQGSIFRWEPLADGDSVVADFAWRHPDALDPGVSWSSRITYVETARGIRVTVRIANTGPPLASGEARLTTRPRLVVAFHERLKCWIDDVPSHIKPQELGAEDIPDFVRYVLTDPERQDPILVLTPRLDGSFVLPPDRFGRDFLTLGGLYVIPRATDTFALTDALGHRALSCFNGGLRVYQPGFTTADDPLTHPLLTARRLDRAGDRLRLAQILARLTTERSHEDPEVAVLRDVRAVAYEARRGQAEQARFALSEQEDHQLAEIYAQENADLRESNDELRAELREAREKIAALEYALSARRRVEPAVAKQTADDVSPDSVRDAVETARAMFDGDLCILDSALASADDSPYAKPNEILHALQALATIATRMRQGGLGESLKDAMRQVGLDYRPKIGKTTSKKLREQYRFSMPSGAVVSCEEHLCIGSATYDPVVCARIYFSTKVMPDGRVVVGHVGRHLKNMTTT